MATEPNVATKAEDDLLSLIEQDPHEPGRHNGRVPEGTHVWAIIATLQGNGWNVDDAASAFRLSEQSMRAALAYYEAYKELIDAELLLQHEAYIS